MTLEASSTLASAAPAALPRRRPLLVWAGMVSAAVLFLLAVGLLYVRWLTIVEPSSVLVVQGHPGMVGARISVQGVAMREPLERSFQSEADLSARFFLRPGSYRLRIDRPETGQVLHTQTFALPPHTGLPLDLSGWSPVPPAEASSRP